jgi:hypothetical protein
LPLRILIDNRQKWTGVGRSIQWSNRTGIECGGASSTKAWIENPRAASMHPVRVIGSSLMIAPYRASSSPWKSKKAVRSAFFAGCWAPVEAARIPSVSGHAAPQFPGFIAGSLTRRLKPISRDLLRTAPIRTFHIVKTFDTFYFPLTLFIFTITVEILGSRSNRGKSDVSGLQVQH